MATEQTNLTNSPVSPIEPSSVSSNDSGSTITPDTSTSKTPANTTPTAEAPASSLPPARSGAVLSSAKPSVNQNSAPAKPQAVGLATTGAAKPTSPSLAASVNAAVARKLPIPKGLTKFNTKELTTGYFHGCVYGETSVRKSSTAATFGSPETTRIILTRRKEQLIPLREKGYDVALVENGDALLFALQYPEQVWPEIQGRTDITLVLDDATEGVNMLLEDASVIDGKEVKDVRRSYREAGDQLREAMKSVLRKPMNFVMVCVAKVRSNDITEEERVAPDLPPSMMNFLITELEFVFYINPASWKLTTDRDFLTYRGPDPANPNKEKVFRREIFAKNKLPIELTGKGVLNKYEDMDLQKLWAKVQNAKK